MKRAIFILLPILAVLAALAFLVLPGSVITRDEKRLAALWDDSDGVFLAEVVEIEQPSPNRVRRLIQVKYKVLATCRGVEVPAIDVDFEVPSPGPITLPADLFRVGAQHLVFLRNARYGPFHAAGEGAQDRAVPATPERIKFVEKLAQPK